MACSIRGTCPSPRLTWKSPSSGDEGLFHGLPYYSTSMSGSKLRILAVRTRRPPLLEADGIAVSLVLPSITATEFGGGRIQPGEQPGPGVRALRTGEERIDIPHGPEQPELTEMPDS